MQILKPKHDEQRWVGNYEKKLVLASVTLLLVSILSIFWLFQNWRIVEFTPACRYYEQKHRGSWSPIVIFDFISGEPTQEFWAGAIETRQSFGGWIMNDPSKIRIRSGKIYTTWSAYIIFNRLGKRHQGEREEWFQAVAGRAAKTIHARRKAEGRFESVDMSAFMVTRRSHPRQTELRHPDECGFMRELIMKGGRFASE